MTTDARSWISWVLPFIVSGGMAFGGLLGFSLTSDAIRQEGTSGDMAGAAGALMVIICLVVGFVMSAATIIVSKLLHHATPGRVALRLGLSLLGGGFAAALASNPGELATGMAWLLLVGVPVVVSWSRRAVAGADAAAVEPRLP